MTNDEDRLIDSMMLAEPGKVIYSNPSDPFDFVYGKSAMEQLDSVQREYAKLMGERMAAQQLSLGSNIVWARTPQTTSVEEDRNMEKRREEDKRRCLKIFIHFAKLFVEAHPKWELVPEEEDPFHKVKLVRKDIGAVIASLYPDNTVAVFGGPDAWTRPLVEFGSTLPIAKIPTQNFFGWALGMDDMPEWIDK